MSSDQNDPATRLSLPRSSAGAQQAAGDLPTLHHTRSELLSSLSHELRGPLHTLNGFLEIVLDYDIGPLTDQQREYLTYARSSAQQLTTLIEDGFILLRGEESIHLQTEDIPFATLLDTAIQIVSPAFAHKRIHLVREIPADPLRINADRSRLQLAVQSILAAMFDSAQEDTSCSIQIVTENRLVICDIAVEIASARAEQMRALADVVEGRAVEERFDSHGIHLVASRLIIRQHGGTFSLVIEQAGQFTARFALPLA